MRGRDLFQLVRCGHIEKLYGFSTIRPLDPDGPRPGWNVVSLTALKYGLFGDTR
jgi:hypothetical protein